MARPASSRIAALPRSRVIGKCGFAFVRRASVVRWTVGVLLVAISAAGLAVLSATERIPGDIDGDGDVDFSDFLILAQNFGKTGPRPTEQQDRPPEKPWDEITEEIRPSTYWLGVTTRNSSDDIIFIGTGFAVTTDAIATNYHVSSAADRIAATFTSEVRAAYVAIRSDGVPSDSDMFYLNTDENRNVLGLWHPEYDGTVGSPDVMVVLLHEDELKRFPSYVNLIRMRDAKELDVGDQIATLGFPDDLEFSTSRSAIRAIPTLKTGTISALRPYKTSSRSANPMGRVSNRVVQHDFNTSPGTSGSPIFNQRGEVVAINNAVSQTEASLGFGIRADEIRHLLQALAVEFETVFVNSEKPAVGRLRGQESSPGSW